ncbi:DUF4265 domain-containing protein [uncultured Veillonella sp.]|uniref:DUF4265 domain-containing protein n=1 Tax=uncultured Veillonella sp. TaxID=159268 RepID=UPI0025CDC222|nr:DUF4265 domain-containing protein [uncultured Veillonella sp.]
MKKLFLNLEVIDGYPPVSMESIWAEETEEGYLKINNIPFYSKEVSFGDIVSVNFHAINIPIQVDIEEIYLFLDEYVETDDLDYDTGYLAQ